MDKKDFILSHYSKWVLGFVMLWVFFYWINYNMGLSENLINPKDYPLWFNLIFGLLLPFGLMIYEWYRQIRIWYKLSIEVGDGVRVKHIPKEQYLVKDINGSVYTLISQHQKNGVVEVLNMHRSDIKLLERGVYDKYYSQREELLKYYGIEKPKHNLTKRDGVIMVWCLLTKVWIKVFGNDNPPPPPRG